MLTLNTDVDLLLRMKRQVCNCNPCSCSEQKKELFFRELKEILASYNKDYTQHHLADIDSYNNPISFKYIYSH